MRTALSVLLLFLTSCAAYTNADGTLNRDLLAGDIEFGWDQLEARLGDKVEPYRESYESAVALIKEDSSDGLTWADGISTLRSLKSIVIELLDDEMDHQDAVLAWGIFDRILQRVEERFRASGT